MDEPIPCPQCGAPARITERFWLASTDGPVEHIVTGCVNHHWLTPRAETLARDQAHSSPAVTQLASAQAALGPEAPSPAEEINMRHALITIHLLHQARDAAIAQAEDDQRLQHQARATPRTQPAEPGRSARVLMLARRVRALAARTT